MFSNLCASQGLILLITNGFIQVIAEDPISLEEAFEHVKDSNEEDSVVAYFCIFHTAYIIFSTRFLTKFSLHNGWFKNIKNYIVWVTKIEKI